MHLNPFTALHPAGPLAPGHANPLLGGLVFGPRAFPVADSAAGMSGAAAEIAARIFGARGSGGTATSGTTVSATQRVLGRNSAGAGAVEEVTITQFLDWLGSSRATLATRGASDWQQLLPGTAGLVLRSAGTGADLVYGAFADYVHLREEKSSGSDGGTFTSGSWQTRALNTEKSDAGGVCTLASNQFTLSAGTYRVRARAPGVLCGAHQLRIQNVSDGTTVLTGSNAYAESTMLVANDSLLFGRFTVAAGKALELQHRCSTTKAANGLGLATGWGTEVYAEVELERESA